MKTRSFCVLHEVTTKTEILNFLRIHQQTPVIDSRYASLKSKRRVRTDKMRLGRLPVESIALYVTHGAACDTPERLAANERFEAEGFVSYRLLLPVMQRLFADVWPT